MRRAGKRNVLLTIQSRDAGTDAAGQPLQTWSTIRTWWAETRTASGMATIRAGLDGVDVTPYSFRGDFDISLTAGMRVVSPLGSMDIKDVRHDLAKKEWTDLVCEVGGNDG